MSLRSVRALRVAIALLLAPAAARSDIAPDPLWQGPSLAAPGDSAPVGVEMASEEVTLTLTPAGLRVEADFHMRNAGASPVTLKVGFPVGYYPGALADFKASRNGKPHAAAEVDAAAGQKAVHNKAVHSYWMLWETTYPAGVTVTDHVVYRVSPDAHAMFTGYRGDEEGTSGCAAGYTLGTGAGWDGVIGKAVVTLKLADGITRDHLRGLHPPGFAMTADGARWTFEKLEPAAKDDIRILYDPVRTLKQDLERAQADPDVAHRMNVLGVLQGAAALDSVNRGAYWTFATGVLDGIAPGAPLGPKTLVLGIWTRPEDALSHGDAVLARLVGEAIADAPNVPEARALLHRLHDLMKAFREGRIRQDIRALKKRNPKLAGRRPDEEPIRMTGVDLETLDRDLTAAAALMKERGATK